MRYAAASCTAARHGITAFGTPRAPARWRGAVPGTLRPPVRRRGTVFRHLVRCGRQYGGAGRYAVRRVCVCPQLDFSSLPHFFSLSGVLHAYQRAVVGFSGYGARSTSPTLHTVCTSSLPVRGDGFGDSRHGACRHHGRVSIRASELGRCAVPLTLGGGCYACTWRCVADFTCLRHVALCR